MRAYRNLDYSKFQVSSSRASSRVPAQLLAIIKKHRHSLRKYDKRALRKFTADLRRLGGTEAALIGWYTLSRSVFAPEEVLTAVEMREFADWPL
jgi:hypothetical protein